MSDFYSFESTEEPEPPVLSPRERVEISQSIARSRRTIRAAFSLACPQCSASKGAYCRPAGHGFCWPRWEKATNVSVPAPLEVGELEDIARATRLIAQRPAERPRRTR